MVVDLAEVHCKLVGPILCGALLVVFIVVRLASRCRDLEGKGSESNRKGGLCQVGALVNTSNRVLAESSLRRRPAATAIGSPFAFLLQVIDPDETTWGGCGRSLLDFRDDVVGAHTSVCVCKCAWRGVMNPFQDNTSDDLSYTLLADAGQA